MTINSMNTEPIAPGNGVLMPPVKVDPAKVKTFENAIAFYKWLSVTEHGLKEVEPGGRRRSRRSLKCSSAVRRFTPRERGRRPADRAEGPRVGAPGPIPLGEQVIRIARMLARRSIRS
jgi:hypothetical protein